MNIEYKVLNMKFKLLCDYANRNLYNELMQLLEEFIDISKGIKEKFIKKRNEEQANSWYLYEIYFEMFKFYGQTLKSINNNEFIESWNQLQNALDCLGILEKFEDDYTLPDLLFFKNQLIELEKLYLFRVFFSVGATFKSIKCSICGYQVYDIRCKHITGQLYMGKLAQRVLDEAVLDEVSIVTNPYDKRCIAIPENGDKNSQFEILKMFISNHKHILLCFKATVYIKYKKEVLSRNAKCTCGSDKKYKYCCGSLDKRKYNHLHIDFLDIHKLNDEFCFN